MGDPKFARKKYERPSHPWRAERIQSENELVKKYGLKNKKEVWKAQSILKQARSQSRNLQARLRTGEPQAQRETELLIARLARMGMLPQEGATLNDILSLDIESVLSRRFQTIFYLKGMSRTAKQARQFIVHGHASIAGRKVTVPSYIVSKEEEQEIEFYDPSPLSNDLHPMRASDDESGVPDALVAEFEKAQGEKTGGEPAHAPPKEDKPAAPKAEAVPKEDKAPKPAAPKAEAVPKEEKAPKPAAPKAEAVPKEDKASKPAAPKAEAAPKEDKPEAKKETPAKPKDEKAKKEESQ